MIAVDRVSHDFGRRRVLDRVSFQVAAHELLCVVGPSGCGKTTLLRIMAGLLRPTEGEVRLGQEVVRGPSRRTAMVFQHFGLFPWKSVRGNIAYGLANRRRRDPERVERLMRTMGLEDVGDRYPRHLSGGMRQRVGLARALAVEPEVLLMDEPFGSLDAITREQLQEELLRIWEHDREVTGVFITHDIDEAILLGDRVVALNSLPPGAGGSGSRGTPGRVSRDIDVPIPRPRTALGIRSHAAYPELRAEIWDALRPAGAGAAG